MSEADFKLRPNADSINSLVATSTLEMGIDIGDLNSELNVGIPPLTANYLQRVGRAGRKSGGALIIDFAKSDPHDLYFFEEPKAMMLPQCKGYSPPSFLCILHRFLDSCRSKTAYYSAHDEGYQARFKLPLIS